MASSLPRRGVDRRMGRLSPHFIDRETGFQSGNPEPPIVPTESPAPSETDSRRRPARKEPEQGCVPRAQESKEV